MSDAFPTPGRRPLSGSLTTRPLVERILADQRERCARGESFGVEAYLAQEPSLRSDPDAVLDLLYHEMLLREGRGETASLQEYLARFPEWAEQLKRQFEIEQVLQETPLSAPASDASSAWSTVLQPPAAPGGEPEPGNRGRNIPQGDGYRLLERIGVGGFGEVWRAEAPGGIAAAIEVLLQPIDREESRQELRALEMIKGLRHHFIMQVHAFWPLADRLYIAMDLADGSLRDRLKECRRAGQAGIAVPELLGYLREAAEALDYLHSRHIQHRDVKPENILLAEGHVRVADFGLVHRHQSQRLLTAGVAGTPPYMAPECWSDKVSPHSDQYSLAATYVELRRDRRMYGNLSSLHEWMHAHREQPPDLDSLSEGEQLVVRKALAKDPGQRYPSCVAFVDALDAALRPPAPLAARPAARWPWVAGLLALALLPAGYVIRQMFQSESFVILQPAPLEVRVGDAAQVLVRVERHGFQGPIPVALQDVPAHIRVETQEATIPAGSDAVQLNLAAREDAPPGRVALRLEAGGTSIPVALTVLPLASLPHGCTPKDKSDIVTALDRRKYYLWVTHTLPDGTPVSFRLIPQLRDTDPPTFYIMPDKVSNGLYRKFFAVTQGPEVLGVRMLGTLAFPMASASGAAAACVPWGAGNTQWQEGGAVEVDEDVSARALGAENLHLPVLRVTALEAHALARWLGGFLPEAREWDKAAGRFEVPRREGAYQGEWELIQMHPDEVALLGIERRRLGPLPLDAPTLDVSPFESRHMAGNGKEWTNTMASPEDRTLAQCVAAGFPPDSLVTLRGQSYFASRPLSFTTLATEAASRAPEEARFDTGFRVVLHP